MGRSRQRRAHGITFSLRRHVILSVVGFVFFFNESVVVMRGAMGGFLKKKDRRSWFNWLQLWGAFQAGPSC